MDVVGAVSTSSGITASWGESVKAATDQGGIYRKAARIARTVGNAGLIGTTTGAIDVANTVNMGTVLFDNDAMANTDGSLTSLSIQTPGYWWLHATAEWIANGNAGLRTITIFEETASLYLAPVIRLGSTSVSTYCFSHWLGYLGADAVLTVRVAQSSGLSTYLNSAWWGLSLSALLVGD
jgi:hypothetical protein